MMKAVCERGVVASMFMRATYIRSFIHSLMQTPVKQNVRSRKKTTNQPTDE